MDETFHYSSLLLGGFARQEIAPESLPELLSTFVGLNRRSRWSCYDFRLRERVSISPYGKGHHESIQLLLANRPGRRDQLNGLRRMPAHTILRQSYWTWRGGAQARTGKPARRKSVLT